MHNGTRWGFDDVRGVVIGPVSHRVALVAPNGNEQAQGHIDHTETAQEWADRHITRFKASMCGDGKALGEHPELFALIYGGGKWEVREYA